MEPKIVAGVDEVGRGSLFASVVAAAVIFPVQPSWEWIKLSSYITEIKDSKQLTAKKRAELSGIIRETCDWSIAEVSADKIDEMNIFRATLYAMFQAVHTLHWKPDLVLVDGSAEIPGLGIAQQAIIDGDNIDKRIAAASIVAKDYRDTLMIEISPSYPEYGLDKNKGYGTKAHKLAIATYGPTALHRKSFRGVSEYVR